MMTSASWPGGSSKGVPGLVRAVGQVLAAVWAFPCFRVPRGTIAHVGSADEVAGMMCAIQRSVMDGAR